MSLLSYWLLYPFALGAGGRWFESRRPRASFRADRLEVRKIKNQRSEPAWCLKGAAKISRVSLPEEPPEQLAQLEAGLEIAQALEQINAAEFRNERHSFNSKHLC